MQGVESIPSWLGDYLGITTASAQALLSLIVILAVLLPVLFLAERGRGSHTLVYAILLLLTSVFLVGIQWLPFWVLIMEVSVFAMVYAWMGSRAIGG